MHTWHILADSRSRQGSPGGTSREMSQHDLIQSTRRSRSHSPGASNGTATADPSAASGSGTLNLAPHRPNATQVPCLPLQCPTSSSALYELRLCPHPFPQRLHSCRSTVGVLALCVPCTLTYQLRTVPCANQVSSYPAGPLPCAF